MSTIYIYGGKYVLNNTDQKNFSNTILPSDYFHTIRENVQKWKAIQILYKISGKVAPVWCEVRPPHTRTIIVYVEIERKLSGI